MTHAYRKTHVIERDLYFGFILVFRLHFTLFYTALVVMVLFVCIIITIFILVHPIAEPRTFIKGSIQFMGIPLIRTLSSTTSVLN